jgi:hypothetical protein
MIAGSSVYRTLLRLYPSDFRRDFHDDLVQLFSDLVERDGAAAARRCTVVDLAVTVPRYRLETVMSSRRSTAALIALIGVLVVGAVTTLAAGFGLAAVVLLLLAAGIAVVERSHLARSLRPDDRGQRHRTWVASALWALLAVGVLVVGMIDLGGNESWPMGRVLVYNSMFLGAAVAAIATFVVGLRRPRSA